MPLACLVCMCVWPAQPTPTRSSVLLLVHAGQGLRGCGTPARGVGAAALSSIWTT